MTDKTMREKIADNRWALVKRLMLTAPKTRHKEGRIDSVRAGIIIDRLLGVKVAGVPLSELIEKTESGKLMELDEDQTLPKNYLPSDLDLGDGHKLPNGAYHLIEETKRSMVKAGFRRVKG